MRSCKICLLDYDEGNRCPLVGSCGHTICQSCLVRVGDRKEICVFCKQQSFISPVPNYDILGDIRETEQNNQSASQNVPRAHRPIVYLPPPEPLYEYHVEQREPLWKTLAKIGAVVGAVVIGTVTVIGALSGAAHSSNNDDDLDDDDVFDSNAEAKNETEDTWNAWGLSDSDD